MMQIECLSNQTRTYKRVAVFFTKSSTREEQLRKSKRDLRIQLEKKLMSLVQSKKRVRATSILSLTSHLKLLLRNIRLRAIKALF